MLRVDQQTRGPYITSSRIHGQRGGRQIVAIIMVRRLEYVNRSPRGRGFDSDFSFPFYVFVKGVKVTLLYFCQRTTKFKTFYNNLKYNSSLSFMAHLKRDARNRSGEDGTSLSVDDPLHYCVKSYMAMLWQ